MNNLELWGLYSKDGHWAQWELREPVFLSKKSAEEAEVGFRRRWEKFYENSEEPEGCPALRVRKVSHAP